MKKTENEKVDVSRRMFFRGAAAVVGAVTTAGVTKVAVDAAADSEKEKVRAQYAKEALRQERAMLQKKFVVMSDDEKQRMLDEILDHHHKQTA